MSPTRLALPVPVVCLVLFAALVGCRDTAAAPVSQPSATRAVALRPPPPEASARIVLREWDARRAQAYADGSVEALRSLYVTGSRAADRDVRLLRSYLARGLVVRGMSIQVLSLQVLRASDRVMRVRVVDRLVGAEAVGSAGVMQLPRDSADARMMTLRQAGGQWLVASVS